MKVKYMAATYESAPTEVREMLSELLRSWDVHKPLLDCGVTIQVQMAYPEKDEDGNPKGDAIKLHGRKALGLCEIINEQNRASGMKDARITLDGDAWADMSVARQKALLEHECYHLSVNINKNGVLQLDSNGRPKLRLRKHTVEIGWFAAVAERHGSASGECQQAQQIWYKHGQAFWPDLCGASTEAHASRFANIAREHGATVSVKVSK